jgi:hypothetical protein
VTRDEVLQSIRNSIARGSATPTLGPDRGEYIRSASAELEAALIDPVPVTILGEANHHGLLEVLAQNDAIAVARSEDHYLGFIPNTGHFFLAYGPDTSRLHALGFSSTDALAEWLG